MCRSVVVRSKRTQRRAPGKQLTISSPRVCKVLNSATESITARAAAPPPDRLRTRRGDDVEPSARRYDKSRATMVAGLKGVAFLDDARGRAVRRAPPSRAASRSRARRVAGVPRARVAKAGGSAAVAAPRVETCPRREWRPLPVARRPLPTTGRNGHVELHGERGLLDL